MRICAAVLLLCAHSAAAREPSVAELFDQSSLFGTWMIDCDREAAIDNPRATVVRPASHGRVIEKDDAGPGSYVNRYTIVSARRLTAKTLSVSVLYRGPSKQMQQQEQIWFVHAGKWRTLFNKPKGGQAVVKDGVVVGSGTQTPVLHRCEETRIKHQATRLWRTPRFPG